MKIKYSLFTILFILYSCGEVENGVDGLSVLVNSEEEPVGEEEVEKILDEQMKPIKQREEEELDLDDIDFDI